MSRRQIGLVVLALVAALVVAGVVVSRSASAHEVFLEAAGSVGPHPFTTTAMAPATTTTSTTVGETSTTAVGETTTTALYGGTGDLKRCDPDALVAFLMAHSDKAKAWVDAQNNDPMLRFSKDGTNTLFSKLTVEDIPTFVAQLTPTFLTKDTIVTNYGYFNGKATPHDAVLQAGMAVLVDRFGIPRVKCRCGNILGPWHHVSHVKYVGFCWPGCHDEPYCEGGDCAVTTTTTEPTSTTLPNTTTTECTEDPVGCGPTTTRPQTSTTRTTSPPGSTSTTRTTNPPPSTTRTTRTTSPPTTQPRGNTTTTQGGKP